MRECIRCGDTKPIDEFGKTPAGNPRSWCMSCHRAYKREWKRTAKGRASQRRSRERRKDKATQWRANNIERVRETNRRASRRYYEKNADALRERSRRERKEHPERWRARRMVADAVFFGVLVKPRRCERCGKRRSLQGHHADYWKPLDVEWLCSPCHATEHA